MAANNSDHINHHSTTSEAGGSNNRHACAACKHQRRRCEPSCPMAPHFPASRKEEFQSVHDIFGVCNVKKLLESLDSLQEREAVVKSIKWEAAYWKQHPVHGPLGYIRHLEEENRRLRQELSQNRPPSTALTIDEGSNGGIQESREYNNYNGVLFSSPDFDQGESSVAQGLNNNNESLGDEYCRFMHEEKCNNPCFNGFNPHIIYNANIYPGYTNPGGDFYDYDRSSVMNVFQAMDGRVWAENEPARVGEVVMFDNAMASRVLNDQGPDRIIIRADNQTRAGDVIRTSRVFDGQVMDGRVGADNGNIRVEDVIRGSLPCYFLPPRQQILDSPGDHRTTSSDNIHKNANNDPNSQRRFK